MLGSSGRNGIAKNLSAALFGAVGGFELAAGFDLAQGGQQVGGFD